MFWRRLLPLRARAYLMIPAGLVMAGFAVKGLITQDFEGTMRRGKNQYAFKGRDAVLYSTIYLLAGLSTSVYGYYVLRTTRPGPEWD